VTRKRNVRETERREDTVSSILIARLAATLNCAVPADGILPPLWHWMLFQEWTSSEELAKDGHPRRGSVLPSSDELPRRVWGGGRLAFHTTLAAGERVTRTSTIARIDEKSGRSGRLVVVTLRHNVSGVGGCAITEEQDIVYYQANTTAVPRACVPPPAAPPTATTRLLEPDPVLLFRFSALTGNAHRIHYDQRYAQEEEGYPGLVVHGPLQAIWLANLAAVVGNGARMAAFNYRGHRAAFSGNPLSIEGWPEDTCIRLRTLDHQGAVCMTAEAELA
jgi:3-methylfumaryl-CoA hydratase